MQLTTRRRERRPVLFLSLAILVAIPALVAGPRIATAADTVETEWRLEKQVDGIVIHTRPVPGSGIRAFKGEGIVEADLESVLAVVRDGERYQDWFPNCPESRMLRLEGSVGYQYSVTAAPWPIDDRDNIFRSELTRHTDTGAVEISIEAAPDFHPEQPGRVRVQAEKGRCRPAPRGEGSTWVIFEMHLDPGGGIPDWMANARIISTPLEALQNLRHMTSGSAAS